MHSFHPGRTAPMASTFKVMLLATYLRQHSVRHRPLRHSDTSLLGPMIKRSDSVAATRVRDIVGVPAIKRLARDARLRKFSYNPVWGLSRDSARDQARFMYSLERYIPRRHRRYALRLLAGIVPSQRWGIGRVHVHGWKLFFKGGWGSGTGAVDHQIALLKSHGERISLADPHRVRPQPRLRQANAAGNRAQPPARPAPRPDPLAPADLLAAVERGLRVLGDDRDVPARPADDVRRLPNDAHAVAAGTGVDQVLRGRDDPVGSLAALDEVRALPAVDPVAPGPAGDAVLAAEAVDLVVAVPALDRVAESRSTKLVVAAVAVDGVAARRMAAASAGARVDVGGRPDVAGVVDRADRDVALVRRQGVGLLAARRGRGGGAGKPRGVAERGRPDGVVGGRDLKLRRRAAAVVVAGRLEVERVARRRRARSRRRAGCRRGRSCRSAAGRGGTTATRSGTRAGPAGSTGRGSPRG